MNGLKDDNNNNIELAVASRDYDMWNSPRRPIQHCHTNNTRPMATVHYKRISCRMSLFALRLSNPQYSWPICIRTSPKTAFIYKLTQWAIAFLFSSSFRKQCKWTLWFLIFESRKLKKGFYWPSFTCRNGLSVCVCTGAIGVVRRCPHRPLLSAWSAVHKQLTLDHIT